MLNRLLQTFLSQKTLQQMNFYSRLPVAVSAPRILINKTGLELRILHNENDLSLLRIFAFLKNLFNNLELVLLHFLHLSLPPSVFLSYNWPVALYVFRAAVPNLFGTRDWLHGKQIFHGPEWGWEDGFRMIQTHTFIVHLISIIITSVPPPTFRH